LNLAQNASIRKLEKLQLSSYNSIHKDPDKILQERSIQKEQLYKELFEKFMQSNSSLLPQGDSLAKERVLNKVMKMIEDTKPPTPYQNPEQYYLIKRLEQEIKEALKAAGKEQLMANANYPLVGTMPTGNVNAKTYYVNSNEFLVVFEDQLFNFCNMLSKVVASAIQFDKIQLWHRQWKDGKIWDESQLDSEMHILGKDLLKRAEIIDHFCDLIGSYLIGGSPGFSKRYPIETPHDSLAFIMLESMELFVVGHEYGHIFNGDLGTSRVVSSFVGKEEVKEIIYPWEKEFLADDTGLKLILWSRQTIVNKLAVTNWDWETIQNAFALYYWGPALFFSSIEIIERAKEILTTGKPPPPYRQEEGVSIADTHPPPLKRRDRSIELIAKYYHKEAYPAGLVVLNIIEVLWATAKPYLVQLYNDGKRLHPRWQSS
jgi:hypothetical protein